ncbi:MAG: hypothetical protein SVY53_07590, partial [Chloroflexota bacterium]|nr:hypothetical protein [Chloroflexota bacterium]
LRNKVVHYKSKSYLPGEGPGKLVKCFAELQLIDVPCDNDVDAHWCELVLVPSVGSWACVTVGRAMVDYNRVTKMYRPVVKKYVDDSLSTLKYSM